MPQQPMDGQEAVPGSATGRRPLTQADREKKRLELAERQAKRGKGRDKNSFSLNDHHEQWIGFLNTDKFKSMCNTVYKEHCGKADDDRPYLLSEDELDGAMKDLYSRAKEHCPCRLPPLPKTMQVFAKYDENMDGYLDGKEFRRFARTHLSCLRWPKWKRGMVGMVGGVASFVALHTVVIPGAKKGIGKILKSGVISKVVLNKVKSTRDRAVDYMKAQGTKLSVAFGGDGSQWLSEEEIAEIARADKAEKQKLKLAALIKTVKDGAIFGMVGWIFAYAAA